MREVIATFQDDSRNHGIIGIEIVRCKDCYWWREKEKGCSCEIGLAEAFENEYCSYGKRRDDATT